jgi:ABC-type transport system involved in multi-copper enzyme maturation permease subunit
MIGTLRSELLKQRSTRTTLLLFVTMVALVALVVAMHVLAPSAASLATRSTQLRVFQVGSGIGMLFAGLAGAVSITAELRYGTIRPTFLVSPRRGPVIAAKLIVGFLTGIIFGLLAQGIMAAAATAAFSARGVVNTLSSGDYVQILLGGAAAAALWSAIGLGIGAVVRNQIGAIVGLCAWALLVESIVVGFVPNVGRFLPGASGLALAGVGDGKLLGPVAGVLVLACYAVVLAAAGWVVTVRRDVA